MIAAALFLAVSGPTGVAHYDALIARMPKDVAAFIERRMGCNHWTGEEPYDKDRGREIARALAMLHCNAVEKDETRLRGRHARERAVLDALTETRDLS